MKKLMVLVAATAMVIASQAAQFDWGADRSGLSNYKNLTVYCVNGSDFEAAVAALAAGGDGVAAAFNAYVKSTGPVNNGGAITTLNSLNAENTAAFFVFKDGIVDGKTYDTTGALDVSSYLYTPPQSGSMFKIANASFTSTSNPIGGGAVPEPTSAMLLLLGVAGLALRRRA